MTHFMCQNNTVLIAIHVLKIGCFSVGKGNLKIYIHISYCLMLGRLLDYWKHLAL